MTKQSMNIKMNAWETKKMLLVIISLSEMLNEWFCPDLLKNDWGVQNYNQANCLALEKNIGISALMGGMFC